MSEWPCPHCGYDAWSPISSLPRDAHIIVCGRCHILETVQHVDGFWMGRHAQSGYPGSLAQFVTEHAEYLKETTRGGMRP